MGPNGAGKSTLAAVLAGKPGYEVEADVARLAGVDLLGLRAGDARHRAVPRLPVPGRAAGREQQLPAARGGQRSAPHRGEPEVDAYDFLQTCVPRPGAGLDEALLARNVNEGFSGGERKRNEILQLAVLEPRLAVLDEIDSASTSTRCAKSPRASTAAQPRAQLRAGHPLSPPARLRRADHVHVMVDGRIAASGDMALVDQLEERGYDWIGRGAAAGAGGVKR